MSRTQSLVALLLVGTAWPLSAQGPGASTKDQKQSRYQVGVMERVLEGAVEHGVTMTRERLQAVVPSEMQFISENAHVRGFRLDGYGVFFDVIVPSFEGTVPWIVRTLDRNDLGLERALTTLKAHVAADGDASLQQALKRVELQVSPMAVARVAAGGLASAAPVPDPSTDSILADPNGAFRAEVRQAMVDAMLDHSGSLGLAANEWLIVAARRSDDRPHLAPADSDAGTVMLRLRGSDLAAFLARQISRAEAIERIEVRVF